MRCALALEQRLYTEADSTGVLDSVEKGVKLSEAGYGVIEDPVSGDYTSQSRQRPDRGGMRNRADFGQSQKTLFTMFGTRPKSEAERSGKEEEN